jgi:hypothetical protein
MYIFRGLVGGPSFCKIKDGFKRRAQGEAFARTWLEQHGYSIVLLEHDNEMDGVDIMTSRGGALFQFAIDREANNGND